VKNGSLEGKVEDVANAPPVDSLVISILTEEQFQRERRPGGMLADGRGYRGSKYSELTGKSDLPDLRGRFLIGPWDRHPVYDTGGEPEHTLRVEQMSRHGHQIETARGDLPDFLGGSGRDYGIGMEGNSYGSNLEDDD